MKKLLIFALLMGVLSAWGLTLNEARSKGFVEELPTGYLKVKDAKAQKLVDEINAKRKTHYKKIAKKSGAPVDAVAKQAATKIKAKLAQ